MDQVAAEVIRDLNDEIQALRVELARERIERHKAEKERKVAIGQVRLMRQDRDFT